MVLAPAVAKACGPNKDTPNRLDPLTSFGAPLALVSPVPVPSGGGGGGEEAKRVDIYINSGGANMQLGQPSNLTVQMPQWDTAPTCIDVAWLPRGRDDDEEEDGEEEDD